MIRAFFALVFSTVSCGAYAQSIEIRAVSVKDDVASFGDKKEQCKITFEIRNNSWGTIHRLEVPLDATDDRGRGVGELLSASASNSTFFTWTSIPKGGSAIFEDNATFKESCKYIASIKIGEPVADRDCAIRQMPEQASCTDVIDLTSAVETLGVSK